MQGMQSPQPTETKPYMDQVVNSEILDQKGKKATSASQAECRRFDPGLPLQKNHQLTTHSNRTEIQLKIQIRRPAPPPIR
jgi:hypothetical protein